MQPNIVYSDHAIVGTDSITDRIIANRIQINDNWDNIKEDMIKLSTDIQNQHEENSFCACFNATFSNISAISQRPDFVVKEAGVPGENQRLLASNW